MLTSEMLEKMMETMLSTPLFDSNNLEHTRGTREAAKQFTAILESRLSDRRKKKRKRSL
jgi:hypothetical protein